MKLRSILVAALLAVVAVLAGSPAQAADSGLGPEIAGMPGVRSVEVAAGPFYMVFRHSSKCAEVPGPTTANVGLDQWTCVSQSNELWYWDPIFYDSNDVLWYRIRNAYSGKCMNVAGNSGSAGASIIQYPCGNYANEYFTRAVNSSIPSGYSWVVAYSSRMVLNIRGGSASDGADLIQYYACYCNNEYVYLA